MSQPSPAHEGTCILCRSNYDQEDLQRCSSCHVYDHSECGPYLVDALELAGNPETPCEICRLPTDELTLALLEGRTPANSEATADTINLITTAIANARHYMNAQRNKNSNNVLQMGQRQQNRQLRRHFPYLDAEENLMKQAREVGRPLRFQPLTIEACIPCQESDRSCDSARPWCGPCLVARARGPYPVPACQYPEATNDQQTLGGPGRNEEGWGDPVEP